MCTRAAHLRDTDPNVRPSKHSTPALAQLEQAGKAPSQRTLRRRQRTQARGRRRRGLRWGGLGPFGGTVAEPTARAGSIGYELCLMCSILWIDRVGCASMFKSRDWSEESRETGGQTKETGRRGTIRRLFQCTSHGSDAKVDHFGATRGLRRSLTR
jgi:hypothetical protein